MNQKKFTHYNKRGDSRALLTLLLLLDIDIDTKPKVTKMISDPYENITKACEDAEINSAKVQRDHAVIMSMHEGNAENNRYYIIPVVQLDNLEFKEWMLMAIAKPSGLVYTWKPVPGYDGGRQK